VVASASTEVPSDPTAYYNDFWKYATYYGEAAARVYYGAWSPPAGTAPPAGVAVATDPSANVETSSPAATSSVAYTAEATATSGSAAASNKDDQAAAQASQATTASAEGASPEVSSIQNTAMKADFHVTTLFCLFMIKRMPLLRGRHIKSSMRSGTRLTEKLKERIPILLPCSLASI
jgi:hypothetical protein